jgi:hypothetical protein
VEKPDSVTARPYTRDCDIGQLLGLFEHLFPRLFPNHALKIPNNHWIWMRPYYRSDYVVRVSDICNPITDCCVDSVFERTTTIIDRHNLRAQHFHTSYIQGLPYNIETAHIDNTVQSHERCGGCCSDTMLSRPGFRNYPGLTHPGS